MEIRREESQEKKKKKRGEMLQPLAYFPQFLFKELSSPRERKRKEFMKGKREERGGKQDKRAVPNSLPTRFFPNCPAPGEILGREEGKGVGKGGKEGKTGRVIQKWNVSKGENIREVVSDASHNLFWEGKEENGEKEEKGGKGMTYSPIVSPSRVAEESKEGREKRSWGGRRGKSPRLSISPSNTFPSLLHSAVA